MVSIVQQISTRIKHIYTEYTPIGIWTNIAKDGRQYSQIRYHNAYLKNACSLSFHNAFNDNFDSLQ